ncbi:unnamed protein product [Somion occarium]|uniref:Uncharacterized protein n=1 Tax=Somion occarium TaxID=3059160 RepID=A0ABP1DU98_9APHY
MNAQHICHPKHLLKSIFLKEFTPIRSASRRPIPPRPRIARVRPVTSWALLGESLDFHNPSLRSRSAFENCLNVEMMRNRAVVAVASFTAPVDYNFTSLFASSNINRIVPCRHLSNPFYAWRQPIDQFFVENANFCCGEVTSEDCYYAIVFSAGLPTFQEVGSVRRVHVLQISRW